MLELKQDIEDIFKILRDDKIREIITGMIAHRIRTDILSDYYKLENITAHLSYYGDRCPPSEVAEILVKFLCDRLDSPRDELCEKFWKEATPNKSHLFDLFAFEKQYDKISALVSDVVMVSSVFKLLMNRSKIDALDVGCGKGGLAEMITKIQGISKINKSAFDSSPDYGGVNKTIHTTDVFSNVDIHFENTDYFDRRDKNYCTVPFKRQRSPVEINYKDETQDLVITKWSLHRLRKAEMQALTKELFRVLRPGGISVVIEGFMAQDGASYLKQLKDSYSQLSSFDFWPEGQWKKDCIKISEAYLNLKVEQQHKLLSFEDYYGHYLLNKRPLNFPFDYIETNDLVDMFKKAGFKYDEASDFFLIGSAPIIRRGPFSARYIFRKPKFSHSQLQHNEKAGERVNQQPPRNEKAHNEEAHNEKAGERKPRIFISYSWTPKENKERVRKLAEELIKRGVEVIIDYKDLKPGHNKNVFMQQMVNDDTIDRVLIICNKDYAKKADDIKNFGGGVQVETTIITQKIFEDAKQEKFIPVVFESGLHNRPFLPSYLEPIIYFDLSGKSDDEVYKQNYDDLLKCIFDI